MIGKFGKNIVVQNIISLFILQGANYLLPLFTLPYLMRVLGVEKFGLIAFAQAFMQYFIILTDYGFNLTATQQIARNRQNDLQVNQILSSVMIVKLLLSLISWIIMNSIVIMVPHFHSQILLYNVVFITVLGNVLFPIWYFQGLEKMKYITILNIIAKIIITLSIFLFVHSEQDYIWAALIQSLTTFIPGLLSWGVIKKNFPHRLVMPKQKDLVQQIREGWTIFLSTAAISLYTSSNLFILGLLTTPVAVGYFSAADKIIKAIQGLLAPINQAIYPHINALFVKSKGKAILFIRKSLLIIGLFSFLLSISIFFTAEFSVITLLGRDYIPSIGIVRILAFLPFIIALSNVFGIQTMVTFGYKKEFSNILIFSGVLNILLIIPLTLFFREIGTAFSNLIVEIAVTLLMLIFLQKKGIYLLRTKRRVQKPISDVND